MSEPSYPAPSSTTIPTTRVLFGDNRTAYNKHPLGPTEFLHGKNYSPNDIIQINWSPQAKKIEKLAKILYIAPVDTENYHIEVGWDNPDKPDKAWKLQVEPQQISLFFPHALLHKIPELRFTENTQHIHQEEESLPSYVKEEWDRYSEYSDPGRHLDGSWDYYIPDYKPENYHEVRKTICDPDHIVSDPSSLASSDLEADQKFYWRKPEDTILSPPSTVVAEKLKTESTDTDISDKELDTSPKGLLKDPKNYDYE